MNDLILGFDPAEGALLLNDGIVEALGHPGQVQLRFDEPSCQLLLRACGIREEQAMVIDSENVEIGGRRLIAKIKELAAWPDNEPRYAYGVYLPGHNAIIFDLRETQIADREGAEWTGNN